MVKPIKDDILQLKVQNVLRLARKTILVVNNEPLEQNILNRVIKRCGYDSISASSGQEAAAALDQNKVDLVISQKELPSEQALSVLVTVKDKCFSTPVLLISDAKKESDEEALISAGADGVITKPFMNIEIERKLKALLCQNR